VSRHQLLNRRQARIWIIINAVLLAAITLWVMAVVFAQPVPAPRVGGGVGVTVSVNPSAPPPIPDRSVFLKPSAPYFGLTTPQSPWSRMELDSVSNRAGAHPTLIQFFVKWTENFRPDAVAMCYKQHALPLLSWEPWAGVKSGVSQPKFALSKIARGSFDTYITNFATAVRNEKWPIVIRFAHEMNGNWYPWSERQSGNHPGDYVRAWRHVHDVFRKVGVTNVIWVWSPNIVRPVPHTKLAPLYPGDAYVDWIGEVGYAAGESTAGQVFDPTLTQMRKFTKKPMLITETGAEPGPKKASWTTTLFPWLRKHPDVVGFVWFELSRADGATADWRFTANPKAQKAFHDGIVQSQLAPPLTYAYYQP
jgi:Glycosyl hydrolase family 26